MLRWRRRRARGFERARRRFVGHFGGSCARCPRTAARRRRAGRRLSVPSHVVPARLLSGRAVGLRSERARGAARRFGARAEKRVAARGRVLARGGAAVVRRVLLRRLWPADVSPAGPWPSGDLATRPPAARPNRPNRPRRPEAAERRHRGARGAPTRRLRRQEAARPPPGCRSAGRRRARNSTLQPRSNSKINPASASNESPEYPENAQQFLDAKVGL